MSHALRIDRSVRADDRISLTFAFGTQIESVGNDTFIDNDVWTLALAGEHWLDRRWAISWEVGHERGDLTTKQRVRAGLIRHF